PVEVGPLGVIELVGADPRLGEEDGRRLVVVVLVSLDGALKHLPGSLWPRSLGDGQGGGAQQHGQRESEPGERRGLSPPASGFRWGRAPPLGRLCIVLAVIGTIACHPWPPCAGVSVVPVSPCDGQHFPGRSPWWSPEGVVV